MEKNEAEEARLRKEIREEKKKKKVKIQVKKNEKKGIFYKYNFRWVLLISLWTFFSAAIFSIITESLVTNLGVLLAFIVLIVVILIGIIFDTIGIAVAVAQEGPFHAMAANRIVEAKHAIKLVRNAGQVSNFCNDVVGDIAGIISGAAATTIVYKLVAAFPVLNVVIISIILTSLTAAFTVGGKALGKSVAMIHNEVIIFRIAIFLSFVENNFGIQLFKNNKK